MITRRFTATLQRAGGVRVNSSVGCELAYDSETDPLTVRMRFFVEGGEPPNDWTLDREFLDVGRRSVEPYGHGDIRMRWFPASSSLCLCLRNTSGHADIRLPWHEVSLFMNDTLLDTPLGDEKLDAYLDDAIERLLG